MLLMPPLAILATTSQRPRRVGPEWSVPGRCGDSTAIDAHSAIVSRHRSRSQRESVDVFRGEGAPPTSTSPLEQRKLLVRGERYAAAESHLRGFLEAQSSGSYAGSSVDHPHTGSPGLRIHQQKGDGTGDEMGVDKWLP